MILKIITPDQDEIIKGKVDFVNLRLSNGYPISIYPGHTQLAGTLQEGRIKFSTEGLKENISVSRGLLLVEDDMVSCYVNWADMVPDGQEG